MIVLDTNVLSELMRSQPDEAVVGWLGEKPASMVFTTSITQAEILHGIRLLPAGQRQVGVRGSGDSDVRRGLRRARTDLRERLCPGLREHRCRPAAGWTPDLAIRRPDRRNRRGEWSLGCDSQRH